MAPSEDLVDEVEAINSIYGDGTLVLTGTCDSHPDSDDGEAAVLALPASTADVAQGDDADISADNADNADTADPANTANSIRRRLSLRLRFPPAYPAGPDAPTVLGVQSVGEWGSRRRPGAAARAAEQFGAALQAAFQEGQVCLFDAVEEFLRQAGEDGGEEAEKEADEDKKDKKDKKEETTPAHISQTSPVSQTSPISPITPPWTVSEPMIELKSVFVARCAPVSSPAEAAAFLQHLLASDRRVRAATHNMTAWRVRPADGSGVVFQDCDDDGETAAGSRLLHLMQLMDLWNVMVVVTRWYGGHKLGPRRFALINQAARDAFVRAGLVVESKKKK